MTQPSYCTVRRTWYCTPREEIARAHRAAAVIIGDANTMHLIVLLSLIASATAFVASPPLARPDTTYADRHGAVVARQLAFVADLTVETEPFKVGAKSVGEWLAQEDALKILMSQAESSRRLDNGESSTAQRWEVATPIQFPGMVVRSETPMDIRIDKVTRRMSISSGASKTVCDGGPPWAQGLLARERCGKPPVP